MAPVKVIGLYDATDVDAANVDELQAALDRLTANVDRWHQPAYCHLTGDAGVDPLTERHLDAGAYHDFPLTTDVVTRLRGMIGNFRNVDRLPVANCGTALCVAGDVVVHNGWTFVGYVGERNATDIVPTANVLDLFVRGHIGLVRDAPEVAREVLNLNLTDAMWLFSPTNDLIDIWAIGYALTGGRLRLPTALPATSDADDDSDVTPELPMPQDVRDAVMLQLARQIAFYPHRSHFARFVDVDRLRALRDGDAPATAQLREALGASSGYLTYLISEIDRLTDVDRVTDAR